MDKEYEKFYDFVTKDVKKVATTEVSISKK